MQEIFIYTDPGNTIHVDVRLEDETLWLSQVQMAELFNTTKQNISLHIARIYKDQELLKDATVKKYLTVQNEGARVVSRTIEHYNLDMIISVGYRVNSRSGTQFRQWATARLTDHLTKGFTINEKRLREFNNQIEELKRAVSLIQTTREQKELNERELSGLLDIMARYTSTLTTLEQYDSRTLETSGLSEQITFTIDLEEARLVINELRKSLKATPLFGNEKDTSLGGILKSVLQTWEGKYLYNSIEEQAAHLLYFIIKNHPFTDGNKRIGAFIFVYFLDRNQHRFDKQGQIKINANGLTALALLVAQSQPEEKEMMIKLIINLIK
jgi:prophage maintenance system killer protein